MLTSNRYSIVVAALAVLAVARVSTALQIVDSYHLGEADPGAAAGNPGNATTIDSGIGAHDLSSSGSPIYSNNVGAPGSTLSMAFDGSSGYSTSPVVSTLTTGVGIDAWVYPTQNNITVEIAYNGNTGGDGWGLLQAGPANGFPNAPGFATVIGLLGGKTYGPSASIPLNTWTELTQLVQGGSDELFVNHVLVGSVAAFANMPSGNFGIGGGFFGNIDEVTVFTTPEPASLILCGIGAVGLLAAGRRRHKA